MKKAKYFVFCLVLFAVVSVYLNITTSLDYNIWGKIVGVRKNEEIIQCAKEFNLDSNVQSNENTKRLGECKANIPGFRSSLRENMNFVSKYKFNVSKSHLHRLMLDIEGIAYLSSQPGQNRKIPTFVTGLSDNHYGEFLGSLRILNEMKRNKYPKMKLIVFELGLSMKNSIKIRQLCNCSIRKFPFEVYPQHVRNLVGFTWKPIIIQTVLQESDFVLWLDSSIRLNNTDPYFQKAKQYGFQGLKGDGSISVRTNHRLFDVLGENPCDFNYPEAQGGLVLIARSCLTLTFIMRPWVSCALEYGCMDFPNSKNYISCKNDWKLSVCHRFDQSVLGIILTRLFNKRRHQLELGQDFARVCRGCL